MKVSVIIPVYNVEDYLAECLDSVINQTERDIEIICVEDCSTDSSLEILQEYAKKDNRIVILQNEMNSGLSVTRNNGLAIAKGEYILFVDSDDLIKPELLEQTLKYADGVDMVCFNYEEYNPQKIGSFAHGYNLEDGLYSNEEYFVESQKKSSFVVVAVAKLYRKDFLLQNNLRFLDGMLYEDNLFYLQCVLKAKNIYSLNLKLYIYRIRPNSIMTKNLQPKNVNDQFRLLYEATNEYLNCEVSKEFGVAIERFVNALGRSYIRCCKSYLTNEMRSDLLDFSDFTFLRQQKLFTQLLLGVGCRVSFSKEQIELMRNSENVIVYGAGDVAREVISYLDLVDIAITGIAVSDASKNKKSLLGNQVKNLSDYENIKDKCLVIIAVVSNSVKAIEKNLCENGFNDFIELA